MQDLKSGLVVFDLDGTLVDTPRAIVETITAVLAALGAPARPPAQIRATIGMPLEMAFSRLLGAEPYDPVIEQAVLKYRELFKELVLPRARELVFPGVAEGLAELRRGGFLLALATSKIHASAVSLLHAAGLFEYFCMIVGADDVARPKPDPESGLAILNALDVLPDEAIMVGDTTHDILMARAAGMRSAAVTYGIHDVDELCLAGPTWLANSFAEVVAGVQTAGMR
jgi:phosphoglycolate phosphatase